MPRPNPGRSINSEENLARRIAYEREWRGLSYEGLASRMTEQGCAMRGSAIYKIEKGDPPRRVTVDELVALARVFEVTVDELLTRVELIEERHAKELLEEFDRVGDLLPDAVIRLFNLWTNYLVLSKTSPELHEFVSHQWETKAEGNYFVAALTADGVTVTSDTRLVDLVSLLSDAIQKLSEIVVDRVTDLGTENVVNAIREGRAPHTAVKAVVNRTAD